jgi:bacterioferritin-associated ferredoxin
LRKMLPEWSGQMQITCSSRSTCVWLAISIGFLKPKVSLPVIVCSCNALRESQIRDMVRTGIRCEREAYARLGCRPQCGQCLTFAREVVRSEGARC